MGTGGLELAVNKLLSRATLDVIGEGTSFGFPPYFFFVFSPIFQLPSTTTTTLLTTASVAPFPKDTIISCEYINAGDIGR